MSKKRQIETAAALDAAPDAPTPSPAEIAEYDAREWQRGNPPAAAAELGELAAPAAERLGIIAPAAAQFRMLPLDRIFASPLNPRQLAADEAAERNLAISIAQKGVLQPILVRPSPQLDIEGDRFEIIMGSRRHKAALRAQAGVDDGNGEIIRLPADYLLPCLVRDCSDDELVILAGVENFDREPMQPLDEAELFGRLRARVTPRPGESRAAAIGRLFHIGERTVFRRLALLSAIPEVREALRQGDLTLQHAEKFALGAPDRQKSVLEQSKRNKHWQTGQHQPIDPSRIRAMLLEHRIPAERAVFDLALYDAEIIEDPETGEKFLADQGKFDRLQRQALESRAAKIREGGRWQWVEVLPPDEGFWQHYAEQDPSTYEKYKASDPDAGAVVAIEGNPPRLVVKCPVLKKRAAEDRAKARRLGLERNSTAAPTARDPLTKAQQVELHTAKTRTLRRRVADDAALSTALAVLGLLGAREVRLGAAGYSPGPEAENAIDSAEEQLGEIELLLDQAREPRHPRDKQLLRGAWKPHGNATLATSGEGGRAWLDALMEMPNPDLQRLFRLLVAERVGSWLMPGGEGGAIVGDSPLAVAAAHWLEPRADLVDPEDWRPGEDWFNGFRKDRLVDLARQLATIAGQRHDLVGIGKVELVALLASQAPGTWRPEHFPECRFQSEKDARAAIAGGTAPTASAPIGAPAELDPGTIEAGAAAELEPEVAA